MYFTKTRLDFGRRSDEREPPFIGGDSNVVKFTELMEAIKARDEDIKAMCAQALEEIGQGKTTVEAFRSRLLDVEQRLAARIGGAMPPGVSSSAYAATVSALVKGFDLASFKQHGRLRVEVAGSILGKATLTTVEAGTVQQLPDVPTLAPDFQLRDVLRAIPVTASAVQYIQLVSAALNAAKVAEGAVKPESDVSYLPVTAEPQTLAHWFRASEQVLADNTQLMLAIDTFGRTGLRTAEENFVLGGDATTGNVGLLTDAPAAAAVAAGTTALDAVLQVGGELEDAGYVPSVALLNTADWRAIRGSKSTDGNYLMPGAPTGTTPQVVWALRVASLASMPAGTFVVLDGRYVAILDRLQAIVEMSNADADNFTKNLITVRCEERIGTMVSDLNALRKGTFATA
ncbi:hypothetical protein LMG23992_02119 [Cupriavidus laharis]|uniref:Phage capsid-like C-terminal domain-containing protein n=1 Tax=Cupriavidus laharis TaxID=151654 RepID=A0ABM8WX34_9BURK|nr:phage major capsid protein [Cupriavidus laharis]CAG9172102.1 hypothetical protein LMG23992_02119 [Cupriavidus laharis]